MTKQDIYILNRALDGKQIYGLPDFEKMHMSHLLIDIYKEGMIRKGLLEDKSTLSTEGAIMVSRIKDYKECNTFVSLNNLTIGKKESGENISLTYNPYYNEYFFACVEMPDDFNAVVDSYPFLRDIIDSDNSFVGEINQKDFEAKYGPLKKEVLHIVRHSNDEEWYYTIFVKEGRAYLYDGRNGSLSTVGKYEIVDKIRGELQYEY